MVSSDGSGLIVSPAEDVGYLLRQCEGVEGLEEDGGDVEVGEAALVDTLDLGGEQKDRDFGDGRGVLHGAEGSGAVYTGHHDIHQDGVWLFGDRDVDAFGPGACGEDVPASYGFQGEGRYFADIVFVVNDEYTSHESTFSHVEERAKCSDCR